MMLSAVLEAVKIPAGGMAPTLMVGDHAWVYNLAYLNHLPNRGDVVVFVAPSSDVRLVKRVIGLPGDNVVERDGELFVNDVPLRRCKLGRMNVDGSDGRVYLEALDGTAFLTFVDETLEWPYGQPERRFEVQEGELFVVGDNRLNSYDSRSWNHRRGGGVPVENVIGEVTALWFPFDRATLSISEPDVASLPFDFQAPYRDCVQEKLSDARK